MNKKIINFPKPKDEQRNIPSEIVSREYFFQMDMFEYYQKHQIDQNYSYVMLLGFFLLVSTLYFLLKGKGFLFYYLIGVVITGIGTFLVMLLKTLILDFLADCEVLRCVKLGKSLEERYPNIISSKLFHRFDQLQSNTHRRAMVSLFSSFAIVLILTALAGVFLSLRVNLWLSISIGAFSVVLLIASMLFIRLSRQILNEEI